MSDVVSGNVAHPRERRKGESAGAWLKQTPAWLKLSEVRPDLTRLPVVLMLAKLAPPDALGTPIVFTVNNSDTLIAVNEDGTGLALIDTVAELARLWERERKTGFVGRKPIENPSAATAATRRWRANRKRI